ncbi:Heavy metal-associated isoprenylated plant protein 32 [Camellia lanceoleosa]|uniref:Heavy metal-associated isoprenylated plant protein 32 n=1 Tax=Camellia lanceoleosa TaxID=1840588 RepID=A0ACC0GSF5_9ERIC|nr:Heavy metal-associated isoprenylated plant protein 32 [Camellia lanceoleosa]
MVRNWEDLDPDPYRTVGSGENLMRIYQQPTPFLFPLLYPSGCSVSVQNMSKEEFLKIQTCVLKVNIHCDGCKRKVKKILHKIDGIFHSISIPSIVV